MSGRPRTRNLNESVAFHAEEIAFQLRELILREMGRRNLDKHALAVASGMTWRNVHRVLIEEAPATILTYARLLAALDLPVDVVARRIG